MKNLNVLISDNSNHAVADAKAKDWVNTLLACQNNGSTPIAVVATQVQLNELRIAVKEKRINPFEFQFNESTIRCDIDGNLYGNPEGLFDEMNCQL